MKGLNELVVWEVVDDQGTIQKQSLEKSDAATSAKVFRKHLKGKFLVRSRRFIAVDEDRVPPL